MKPVALSALSLVVTLLGGCSADSTSETSDDALARGASSQTKVEAYTFDPSGENPDQAPFLARLNIKGGEITGYTLTIKADQMQAMGRMAMRGRVESDGTYKMTWALSFKGTQEVPLVVKPQAGALVGKIGEGNDQKDVTLKPIKPGPTPIVGIFHDNIERGPGSGCQLDVGGIELFGVAKPAIESAINAKLKKIDDRAKELCQGNVDYISGGSYPAVITNEVFSYSASYRVSAGDDERVEPTTRENLYLDTGKSVVLFGDVLQPGSDDALLAEIEKAIDAAPERDVPADKKAELKGIMRAQKTAGKLPKEFLLAPRGLSFAAPGYSDPRISSVLVKWDALTSLLVPNGKAHTAWDTRPATP